MCQGQQPRSNKSGASKDETPAPARESSRSRSEEWSGVEDPSERRKIQNKLAQRRFRDKVKEQKEESEREAENQQHAASSYAPPEAENLDSSQNLSGLPWGGISFKHIVETGKSKEQGSQQSSRENSVKGGASRTGGPSLVIRDHCGRDKPSWNDYRYSPYGCPSPPRFKAEYEYTPAFIPFP